MMAGRWEYCLINCTRMPGRDEDEHRVVCQLIRSGSLAEVEYREREGSPLVAVARALNELGSDGWELVSYDTSTNRGVLKRPQDGPGEET